MKFSSPSPRRQTYRSRKDVVESPTSPSDRPLMYLSSSSGSSSFDELESVPMLSSDEGIAPSPSASPSASPRRKGVRVSCAKRRRRFLKPYQSCIAFIVLAYMSYFFVRKEAATGHDQSALSIRAEIQNKDQEPNDIPINAELQNKSQDPTDISTHAESQNNGQDDGQDPNDISTHAEIQNEGQDPNDISTHAEFQNKGQDPKAISIAAEIQIEGQDPQGLSVGAEIQIEGQDPQALSVGAEIQNKGQDPNAVLEPSSSALRPSPSSDTINMAKVQKKKNNLVLHIGPQKTGSTTLQYAWGPNGLLSQSLKEDNYQYRFINPKFSGYFRCDIGEYGAYRNCEASPKLKGLIRMSKNDGHNLLLSDENLDERYPEALRDVIDDNDWDVTVIVVYRRIHQWLISWYDQINKTTNRDAKGNLLIDTAGAPYRLEHTLWPDEGGAPIPSFSSWYKEFTRYWDSSELVSKHRSIAFMNDYKPYFKNVVVHNMHQDGDLMTNFMCDSVPDAHHSCQQLKHQAKLPRNNQSVNLDYDILAVKAREKGFLVTTFKRQYVVSEIEKFIKETNKHLQRVCDIDMIDEIRNWLLDSEKTMFQETWSDEKSSDLNLLFDSYVESGKLCDVDFDQVFADEEWLDFFKSLDSRTHLVLHIGPQKTGSSTLQHVWDAPKELRNVMEEDNFDYHFINPHKGMFDCEVGEEFGQYYNCKATDKLVQIIANAKANRRNLLLSDENLADRFVGALREVINDKDFRVKVVLVYRRIHRWLPSWYSQIEKTSATDSKGNLLPNDDGHRTRKPHTEWPSDGGVYVPNFIDWYKKFVEYSSDDLASNHPSVSFKNSYVPYFDDVEVYNMEQEGDLVTNFMCQMVPEASKTCHRLKEGSIDIPIMNPSVNVEHDILSVQAYDQGLIDKRLSRPTVVEEVRKHIQNASISLPRICDDEVKQQIHDWLLDSEKAMFPKAWSPSTSDALEGEYNDYYEKGKLCNIDIETVLGDEAWIDFFASLGKTLGESR